MIRIVLFSALLFAGAFRCASAQDSLSLCSDSLPAYYSGVKNVIDGAIGGSFQLSITIFPSFEPEYGLRMAEGTVYLARLRSSFWYSSNVFDEKARRGYHDFSKPKIAAKIISAPLSANLIDRITKVYAAAILSPIQDTRSTMDGVSYRFELPLAGCGEVSSPSEGTRAYRLISLVNQLGYHAKLSGGRALRQSSQLIERKVVELERQ